MDERGGTNEKCAVAYENDDAIGQAGAAVGGDARLKRVALQRGESKGAAGRVVAQNEQHGAMAEAAVTVVEKQFGLG